jgi:hypothetical protein
MLPTFLLSSSVLKITKQIIRRIKIAIIIHSLENILKTMQLGSGFVWKRVACIHIASRILLSKEDRVRFCLSDFLEIIWVFLINLICELYFPVLESYILIMVRNVEINF